MEKMTWGLTYFDQFIFKTFSEYHYITYKTKYQNMLNVT